MYIMTSLRHYLRKTYKKNSRKKTQHMSTLLVILEAHELLCISIESSNYFLKKKNTYKAYYN